MNKTCSLILLSGLVLLVAVPAFADGQDAGTLNLGAVAAAIGIAIAAAGGALGQGKAAAAALEGIARNPSAQDKLFVPMIIALVFIESLVIYALVIAFMVRG